MVKLQASIGGMHLVVENFAWNLKPHHITLITEYDLLSINRNSEAAASLGGLGQNRSILSFSYPISINGW